LGFGVNQYLNTTESEILKDQKIVEPIDIVRGTETPNKALEVENGQEVPTSAEETQTLDFTLDPTEWGNPNPINLQIITPLGYSLKEKNENYAIAKQITNKETTMEVKLYYESFKASFEGSDYSSIPSQNFQDVSRLTIKNGASEYYQYVSNMSLVPCANVMEETTYNPPCGETFITEGQVGSTVTALCTGEVEECDKLFSGLNIL